jgi:hypothetical protein
LAAGGRIPVEVGRDAFDRPEEVYQAFLFGGKMPGQQGEVPGDIPLRDADVVLRKNSPVKALVGHKVDIRDLRETRNEVVEAVALADRRRVERDIELEPAGTLERRRIPAGDAVLLQDERLEALAGEGGGAAQPAEPTADDDGVPGVFGRRDLVPPRERVPVEGQSGNPRQRRFQEIPAHNCILGHDALLSADLRSESPSALQTFGRLKSSRRMVIFLRPGERCVKV